MNDGVKYLAASPLTVSLDASGRGGIDTGSKATDTWYYIYAVPPATAGGSFACVASVSAPTAGPTGFSAWKYLGAIRYCATVGTFSEGIMPFQQVGSRFIIDNKNKQAATQNWTIRPYPYNWTCYQSSGSATDPLPVSHDLSGVLPATATTAAVYFQNTGGTSTVLGVFPDTYVDASNDAVAWIVSYSSTTIEIQTPATPKKFYIQRFGDYSGCGYTVRGWTDGYLTTVSTQPQPMQTLTGSNGAKATITRGWGANKATLGSQAWDEINTSARLTFTTVAGEQVLLSFQGDAYRAAGVSSWLDVGFVIDDNESYAAHIRSANPNTYDAKNISFTIPMTLPAGAHTAQMRWRSDTTNTWIMEGTTNRTSFACYQFQGGYSNPDNVPILEYSSASAISVKAAPGASGMLQVTLSDGQKYTAASPLSVSLAASGRGGLDTGSEASSTWYYIYAVPPATSVGSFACVASASPPSTGPTGFTGWKYLGAVRNDSSSNLIKFFQIGNVFQYQLGYTFGPVQQSQTMDAWVDLDVSGAIPATATQMQMCSTFWVTANWTEIIYAVAGQTVACYYAKCGAPSGTNQRTGSFDVPIVGGVRTVREYLTSHSAVFEWLERRVNSYVDGWLSGAPQVQAKAVADTKLPRLTWVGSSSVTVAAAPGQSSTVRVTLQDGTQRSFTGTLTFDPSTGATDGGLDTGTEASSTWYYLYLVPKSTDTSQLVIRGSVTGPATGPTGYTSWAYIGAVYNNSSSNIKGFMQETRDQFSYPWVWVSAFGASLPADTSPVAISLAACVPVTAKIVKHTLVMNCLSGRSAELRISPTDQNSCSYSMLDGGTFATNPGNTSGQFQTPIMTAQTVYRYLNRTAGSGNIDWAEMLINGWTDGYLS